MQTETLDQGIGFYRTQGRREMGHHLTIGIHRCKGLPIFLAPGPQDQTWGKPYWQVDTTGGQPIQGSLHLQLQGAVL
jgi:hypothetical protein